MNNAIPQMARTADHTPVLVQGTSKNWTKNPDNTNSAPKSEICNEIELSSIFNTLSALDSSVSGTEWPKDIVQKHQLAGIKTTDK